MNLFSISLIFAWLFWLSKATSCPFITSNSSDSLTSTIISKWNAYWSLSLSDSDPTISDPGFNTTTLQWASLSSDQPATSENCNENQVFNQYFKVWVCKTEYTNAIYKGNMYIWGTSITTQQISQIASQASSTGISVLNLVILASLISLLAATGISFWWTGIWWFRLKSK